MSYTTEPQNFTAADALQAVRTPSLRGYLVDHSVPWRAVDLTTGDALPRDAQDRDEINYLADLDNGVVWRLVYLTATGYWHYIGGPPMRDTKADDDTFTLAAYADGAPVGPTVTVPLTGDYHVHWGGRMSHDTAGGYGHMSIKNGSTATSDADGLFFQTAAGFNDMKSYSKEFTVTGGDVVKVQYSNGSGVGTLSLLNAATPDNAEAFIEVVPRRIF